MESKRNTLFDKIMSLVVSNPQAALKEFAKLDPKSLEEFNFYHANKVLHSESAIYRGRAIEMSIYLENVLARFLSHYFGSENKRDFLNSMIFDRMDLQRKLNTLKSVIKTKHPKIWKREQSNLKKMDKLILFRNNLAHSVLNSTHSGKNNVIDKVKELNRNNSTINHLEEIEYGYFENHKWVYKSINLKELNEYIQQVLFSLDLIENIGSEVIENYSRITVK